MVDHNQTMAQLFSAILGRAICRHILFTVLWELAIIVNKCTSNQDICTASNRTSISYFNADIAASTWTMARETCNAMNSILPVICDKNEQDAILSYLKDQSGYSSVWTSGKKINLTDWKWIDGQPFNKIGMIPSQNISYYTHVALDPKLNNYYKAEVPHFKIYYLCQYSGSSCNSEDVRLANNRCVRKSDDDRTWFDARNQCLMMSGGDLAIINDTDLMTLRGSNTLYANRSYWIGLRKITWHWMRRNTESESGEEIKYTNWSNDPLYFDCISIYASSGEWKADRCTDAKRVVCQTNETTSSKMKTGMPIVSSKSSTTTNSQLTISDRPTSLNTTSRVMSNTLESAAKNTTDAGYQVLLINAVAVGLGVVIISNIIVALVVRKYYLRANPASSNIATTGTECYQDVQTTRGQANSDGTYTELQLQPVYEEVSQRGK